MKLPRFAPWIALLALWTAGCADSFPGIWGPPASAQTTPQPAAPALVGPRPIISLIQIGGTDSKFPRGVAPYVLSKAKNWQALLEERLTPQIAAGVRRFMIWSPCGYTPGKPLDLTQQREARDAGFTYLSDGFGKAIKPYIDRHKIEVIVYLGQMPKDEILSRLDGAAWLATATAAVREYVDAGCHIALDDVDDHVTEGDRHETFVRMLASLDVVVYIEPRIAASKPSLLHDLPSITVAHDAEKFAKTYKGDAEHILLLGGTPPPSFGFQGGETGDDWNQKIPGWCRATYAAGKTPCFSINQEVMDRSVEAIREFVRACSK